MNTRPRASLEALAESDILPLEVLHPGGLDTTRELAAAGGIGAGMRVLDVASGTGETARMLIEELGADVVGVDHSARMIERARRKVRGRGALDPRFVRADAHALPFADRAFDAVISECTLSLLDKDAALAEMTRVARPAGTVGVHEICWKPDAPDRLKRRLVELEGERPETLDGWIRRFEAAGLVRVRAVDRSELIPGWMRESARSLGVLGRLRVAWRVLRRWGLRGLVRILASEWLFRSRHLGYGIVTGVKPVAGAGERGAAARAGGAGPARAARRRT